MKKLYKKIEKGRIAYSEYWLDQEAAEVTFHEGIVGEFGEARNFPFEEGDSVEELDAMFTKRFEEQGFTSLEDEDKIDLVLQLFLKDEDHLVVQKPLINHLQESLGWKGLGHIDGSDFGKQLNNDEQLVLNIFCEVVEEKSGIETILETLEKTEHSSFRIASRIRKETDSYSLKHCSQDSDAEFSF